MPAQTWPPVPPFEMPPVRTVRIPDRGELFLRDTGGDGPPVMLLHGWMASADLNWAGCYQAVSNAGYRVLAIDHRGHGRGLRQAEPFRLVDCAADAAATLRALDAAPAIIVGYSMGGAIAQLVARNHPDVASGVVLSGTAQHWQDPQTRRYWRAMAALGLVLSISPQRAWRAGFRRVGLPESARTAWLLSEVTRHSARDVAEAGRELGRFDSRPWVSSVSTPSAVVVTSRDTAVPPRKQNELAAALGARVFDVPIDHLEIVSRAPEYNAVLLQALQAVGPARGMKAA